MATSQSEARFQTVFKHWLQANWDGGSAAFELKRTTKDRLSTRAVSEHQQIALTQAYDGTLYYKIPDTGYGQKPFDCFVLQNSLSYIVVAFGPRLSYFYIIPIWVWNKKTKGKASVTRIEVEKWEDIEKVLIPRKK